MVLSAEKAAAKGSPELKRRPTAVVKQLTRGNSTDVDGNSARYHPGIPPGTGNDVSRMATVLAAAYESASQLGTSAPHMAPALLEQAYGPVTTGR